MANTYKLNFPGSEIDNKLSKIKTNGAGDKFLADDGTYKEVSGGSGTSIDDTTTTATDKTWSASKIKREIDNKTVSDSQISSAVNSYLTENPPSGVTGEAISSAVSEYLTENPVSGISETDQEKLDKIVIDGEKGLFLNQKGNYVDIEKDIVKEFAEDNTVWGANLPVIFIDGDLTDISKETPVDVYVRFTSQFKNFEDTATLNLQGNSSVFYPKKNFTVKFTSKHGFGWGKEKKWVLKANYIDHSHARNIVCARLWSKVVKSRSDYNENVPQLLKESPNHGAIDGFPVRVYLNSVYQGLYTFNIPKGDFLFNMDKTNNSHIYMFANGYNSACFQSNVSTITKDSGSEWEDGLRDTPFDGELEYWNEIITFVKNSDDETFKANLSNYFDIQSLIDYYLFSYIVTNLDGFGKNQIFISYDATKFYASAYDLDSTIGLYSNGGSFVSPQYKCMDDYESGVNKGRPGNKLYERLVELFEDEIVNRYSELRNGVLSESGIISEFEKFIPRITTEQYAEDLTIYSIPNGANNNIKQIRQYVVDRLRYVDAQIVKIDITALTATIDNVKIGYRKKVDVDITPSNANTYTLTYSSDKDAIATVDSTGYVTGVSEGTATITITDTKTGINCTVDVVVEAIGDGEQGGNTVFYGTKVPIQYNKGNVYTTNDVGSNLPYMVVKKGYAGDGVTDEITTTGTYVTVLFTSEPIPASGVFKEVVTDSSTPLPTTFPDDFKYELYYYIYNSSETEFELVKATGNPALISKIDGDGGVRTIRYAFGRAVGNTTNVFANYDMPSKIGSTSVGFAKNYNQSDYE